jgi:cysteinyl-tRNA synthetase
LVAEAYRRADFLALPALIKMDRVLGLRIAEVAENASDEQLPTPVVKLLDERAQARSQRNFKRADEIRGELAALGYEVKDTPQGPVCTRRP